MIYSYIKIEILLGILAIIFYALARSPLREKPDGKLLVGAYRCFIGIFLANLIFIVYFSSFDKAAQDRFEECLSHKRGTGNIYRGAASFSSCLPELRK